jgi:hypothetical protein
MLIFALVVPVIDLSAAILNIPKFAPFHDLDVKDDPLMFMFKNCGTAKAWT